MKKFFLLSLTAIFFVAFSYAQNVGIGTTTPDASAALEVFSANKGLLIPRIALTGSRDQATIPTPAVSLLIYNTSTVPTGFSVFPGYYYWGGNSWIQLAPLTSSSTPWFTTGNAGTNPFANFIGTTDDVPFNVRVNNQLSGKIDSTLKNSFWGFKAGSSNTDGYFNTATGFKTLLSNTSGYSATAYGVNALYSNTTGNNNTANGAFSLYSNTTGYGNVAIGASALYANIAASNLVAIGDSALFSNKAARNTAVGAFALFQNVTGIENTATGNSALSSNSSGSSNTANGYEALSTFLTGDQNTAIGSYALQSQQIGNNNTAIGSYALAGVLSSGNNNTANGVSSLRANKTGNNNAAVGYEALRNNQSGYSNVAMGVRALFSNTATSNLIAIGDSALYNNGSGTQNTAIGSKALYSNTGGNQNTATGRFALYLNQSGVQNTAYGTFALQSNTTGSFNTAVGYGADVSAGNLTNSVAIGYGATVNASNKIRLGNPSISVIEGQVAYSFPSDARFKYNIQNNVPGLDFIKNLTPVTYYFDEQKLEEYTKTGYINNSIIKPASYNDQKQLHSGFLAQDVEKIAKELGYTFDGVHAPANDKDHYSLAYSQFVMPLVKAVQELSNNHNALLQEKEEMKIFIRQLQKRIEILENQKK
ncbi:MAG: hypothetical protein JWQ09_4809 [Segetibacter sp.]|nr:hypothetical protein [Segetibacter sp.]